MSYSFSSGNARYDAEYYDNIGQINPHDDDFSGDGSELGPIASFVVVVVIVLVAAILLA